MWTIIECNNNTSPHHHLYIVGGGDIVGVERGPKGASYRLVVINKGALDLLDVGWGTSTWEIDMNGQRFKYHGGGEVTLTFNSNGTFTATGQGNNITGNLKPC